MAYVSKLGTSLFFLVGNQWILELLTSFFWDVPLLHPAKPTWNNKKIIITRCFSYSKGSFSGSMLILVGLIHFPKSMVSFSSLCQVGSLGERHTTCTAYGVDKRPKLSENALQNPTNTVDGRDPAPVEVGSLSHYLQGFINTRTPKSWNDSNVTWKSPKCHKRNAIFLSWLSKTSTKKGPSSHPIRHVECRCPFGR